MGIEQNRERIVTRVRQAIQQSGANLSGVPADQQERLINTVADGVLLELDSILDDVMSKQMEQPDENVPVGQVAGAAGQEETIQWQGRPFLNPFERYVVTTDRVRIFHGVLSKTAENLELVRLQDVDYHQGVSERILGIGDVTLRSADASDPVLVLNNVRDPEKVQSIIRQAWLAARQKYGVRFREEM